VSSTTQATQYNYAFNLTDPQTEPQVAFTLTQTATFDDTAALDLFAALKAAIPGALLFNAAVTKTEASNTVYTTDLAATPPAFE
jgi:hypothetical protein